MTPPTVGSYETLKMYVDALSASAARCRRMLIIIAVASVLFFIAFWNSRESSWMNLRIRAAQECIREKAFMRETPEPRSASALARFLDLRSYLSAKGLFAENIEDGERMALLQSDIAKYRELQKEWVVFVHVPFFASVFDVNDLGIIAGITFTLLLLGYWFSVTRERDTLNDAFTVCGGVLGDTGEHRRRVYSILSTSQVLNVPHSPHLERRKGPHLPMFVKKYLAKGLILPPMLIQIAIMWNDQGTLKYGLTLGEQQTSISVMAEGVCLVAIMVLTVLSTLVSLEITHKWDQHLGGSDPADGDDRDPQGDPPDGSADELLAETARKKSGAARQ